MKPIVTASRRSRIIIGAALASLAVALFFTLFGFAEEGVLLSDFLTLFALAIVSYEGIGLLIAWKWSVKWNLLLAFFFLVFLGSGLFSFLTLVFIGRQNGIPAYMARMKQQNPWQPLADLVWNRTGFAIITMLIAFPVVAAGVRLLVVFHRRLQSARSHVGATQSHP